MSQDERSCATEEKARWVEELRRLDHEIRTTRETLYRMKNPSDYLTHYELHYKLDELINKYTRLAEKLRRGR